MRPRSVPEVVAVNLLAIDTATEACMIGLQAGERRFAHTERAGRAQTERILPMIDALSETAGIALRELDAIVMGRGPGAFTGLRVTAGVVQGLAFALDLPVVPLSSLRILAQTAARRHGAERVIAAFDARMDEVYWCACEYRDGIMVTVGEERLTPPEQVGQDLDGAWFGVGPAWAAYAGRMGARLSTADEGLMPQGEDALELGARALAAGEVVPPERAIPVYLRNQVAWKKSPPPASFGP